MAALSGVLWIGIDWIWYSTNLASLLALALGFVAAGVGFVVFYKLPPGASREISHKTAVDRAVGFSAASLFVALGLPCFLSLLFPLM
jgi:hypothetical protein